MSLADLHLFGPGSEWFWAMAQFVVVAVTLLAIYRQLKAQGAANAFARIGMLEEQWAGRAFQLARLRAAIRLRTESVGEMDSAMIMIANYLENLAILRRDGHLTLGEIDDTWSVPVQMWWAFLRPVIEQQRARDGNPRMHLGLERLAADLHRLDVRQVGHGLDLTPDKLPAWLDEQIRRARAALERMNEVDEHVIPDLPQVPDTVTAAEARAQASPMEPPTA